MQANHPGRVSNELLLKDFSTYLREEDPEDSTNYVIDDKKIEKYDYKLVPKKVWDEFEKNFGGMPIMRAKEKAIYSYSYKYVIKYPSVSESLLKFEVRLISFYSSKY